MPSTPGHSSGARAPRRPGGRQDTAGAKMLLTTTALAAMLGGWVMLTGQDAPVTSKAADAAGADAPDAWQPPAAAEPVSLDLPPLPTLVALVTPQPVVTVVSAKLTGAVPPTAQPTAQPTAEPTERPAVQAIVQPAATPTAQPTPKPAPALRVVARPVSPQGNDKGGGGGPAPVASTKSSH